MEARTAATCGADGAAIDRVALPSVNYGRDVNLFASLGRCLSFTSVSICALYHIFIRLHAFRYAWQLMMIVMIAAMMTTVVRI